MEGIPREKDLTSWETPQFIVYPPPSNLSLIPKMDASTKAKLRGDQKAGVVDADNDLATIQGKVQDVVGPLGVVWAQLVGPTAKISNVGGTYRTKDLLVPSPPHHGSGGQSEGRMRPTKTQENSKDLQRLCHW